MPSDTACVKRAFARYDDNGDGLVSRKEVALVVSRLTKPAVTGKQLDRLIKLSGAARGTGKQVCYDTFVDFLFKLPAPPPKVGEVPPVCRKKCCMRELEFELEDPAVEEEVDRYVPPPFVPHEAPPLRQPEFPIAISKALMEVLQLRDNFLGASAPPGPTVEAFSAALDKVIRLMNDRKAADFCSSRLKVLEARFSLYKLENLQNEAAEVKEYDIDLTGIPKVDAHLHASAIITAPQLSSYMHTVYGEDKDRVYGNTTVGAAMRAAGFDERRITGSTLSDFGAMATNYSPIHNKKMRDLYLSTTELEGEYFFNIVRDCAATARVTNGFLEPRFSIYGKCPSEWEALARWIKRWKVDDVPGLLIAVQFPRVYRVWKKRGLVQSFAEMLHNFWQPLFDAARCPQEHEDVASLLLHLRLIDTVDDESKEDEADISNLPEPDQWTGSEEPPYSYYIYHMHANLSRLNGLRAAWPKKRRISDFGFPSPPIELRPHCGEAGPSHHLATAFLFCHGISHGINLENSPVLQYLFYLAQVCIAMSPLSNSTLLKEYRDNPFAAFFRRGLRVSLATDDPMMFHVTHAPLLEEYVTARNAFELDEVDLSEVGRNSCFTAFSVEERSALHDFDNPRRTNIPPRRLAFRTQALEAEWTGLEAAAVK